MQCGKGEVSKRILSEEGRINHTEKKRYLMQLRDEVFRVVIHDSIGTSVSQLRKMKRWTAFQIETGEEEDEDIRGVGSMFEDEACVEVRNDYDYSRIKFVYVRKHIWISRVDAGYTMLWVSKVSDLYKNRAGKVVRMKLHWYELTRSTYCLTGKYCNEFLDNRKDYNRGPWTDTVPIYSLMITFDSLTKKTEFQRQSINTCDVNFLQYRKGCDEEYIYEVLYQWVS